MTGAAKGYLLVAVCGLLLAPCVCNQQVSYRGDHEVSEGEPFRIICIMPARDPPEWSLNGSWVITADNDLGYDLSKRKLDPFRREMTLRAASAQAHHEGEYRCDRYSREYHYVRIQLDSSEDRGHDKDKTGSSSNENVEEHQLKIGQTYEFHCKAPKHLETSVTWYKNGQVIDSNVNSNLEISKRVLFIHEAQEEDAGKYTCIPGTPPITERPSSIRTFHLNSPARISDFPASVNAIRGRALYIQCRARGFPQPTITWFIDNLNASVLKERDTRISTFSKAEKKSTASVHLVVRNMSEHDRGLYTCRAHNSPDGYDEKTVFVHVRDNMITTNEDEPGLGKILIPGQPLLLHCNTTECPQCILVWFKDGHPLDSIPDRLQVIERNNSIIIQNPTLNDTGLYVCAINRTQLDVDISAAIKVQTCSDFFNQGYLSQTLSEACEIYSTTDKAALQEITLQAMPLLHVIITFFWARVII